MGDVVLTDKVRGKWLVGMFALLGCIGALALPAAPAQAAPSSTPHFEADAGKSSTAVRKRVKCPMGSGYVFMNLKKMRCKPALRVVQKWIPKFNKKPKRAIRVNKFTCRWKGKLKANAVGTVTCKKKGKRGPSLAVKRP